MPLFGTTTLLFYQMNLLLTGLRILETLAALASIPNFTLHTTGISSGASASGAVVINVDPNVPARDRATELAAQRSITGANRDEAHVTLLMRDALRYLAASNSKVCPHVVFLQ